MIIGISYKPNIADIRESPTIRLIEELRSQGNEVVWHDPLVKTWGTESSVELNEIPNVDFVIVSILHDAVDKLSLIKTKTGLYDLTGTLKEANNF